MGSVTLSDLFCSEYTCAPCYGWDEWGGLQSKLLMTPLHRLVKAVQDFSGGCFTSIGPQIYVPFNK